MTWKPLHLFAMALAGWMNLERQNVIAYLREENRILREKLGHKRIILNESTKRTANIHWSGATLAFRMNYQRVSSTMIWQT